MRKDIESQILERAHRAMKPVAPKEVGSQQQETCDVHKKKKKKNKNVNKTTINEIPVDDTIKKEKKKKKKDKKRGNPEEDENGIRENSNENEIHSESFSEEQTPSKKIKPEDVEEASRILESCDKVSEKKKKRKDKSKKKKKEDKKKDEINEHGLKRAATALVYLQKWDTDRVNWKFEKLHQVWLLQNCLNVDRFPDSNFSPFLRYIAGMRGKAREEQIKTMNKVLSQHEEWISIKEQTGKSDLELQEDLKRNVTTPRMIERAQQILDVLSNE